MAIARYLTMCLGFIIHDLACHESLYREKLHQQTFPILWALYLRAREHD